MSELSENMGVPSEFQMRRVGFDQVATDVPSKPGIYVIRMNDSLALNKGQTLKVGIAADLRSRLLQHRASLDSYLRMKTGGSRDNPDHVSSKGSILAKHLYYDTAVSADYDLTSEAGRRNFLRRECHILFHVTASKHDARELEKAWERDLRFRYVGKVVKR